MPLSRNQPTSPYPSRAEFEALADEVARLRGEVRALIEDREATAARVSSNLDQLLPSIIATAVAASQRAARERGL